MATTITCMLHGFPPGILLDMVATSFLKSLVKTLHMAGMLFCACVQMSEKSVNVIISFSERAETVCLYACLLV